MEKFKIALAQLASEPGNLEANLEKMLGYIKRAGEEGAKLVIFPEMSLPGYMVMDGKDFESFFQLATDFNDSATRALAQASSQHQLSIIYGTSTRSLEVEGIYYNSAVIITPEGMVDFYHKTHLPAGEKAGTCFYEPLYAKPGSEFPIFELESARVGIEVCYDIFFPEVSRILASKGAELIVNISAAPVSSRYGFEVLLPARALENTCYFAYVNVAGEQRGVKFFGGSRVLNPLGTPVVELKAEEEDFKVVELEPELLVTVRRQLNQLQARERRPEIYWELCEEWG